VPVDRVRSSLPRPLRLPRSLPRLVLPPTVFSIPPPPRQRLREQRLSGAPDGGLLVHCSGGVGRTGVFLAAYHTVTSVLPLAGATRVCACL
jgi:protein tyrosine phosphatase